MGDFNIKLNVVSIEFVLLKVEELLILFYFEIIDDLIEFLGEHFHSLQIEFGQLVELLNGIENVY